MARIDRTLSKASSELSDSKTARLDAELLLAHVLDKPRSYFFTWPEKELSETQQQAFQHLIDQRKQGTPVAYLIGEREFWSLSLKVNEDTLIPRPDTELLVELALAQPIAKQARIVDLGTGTGAIALALAHERPNWHISAVDMNAKALTIAKENAQLNRINNVSFIEGSWCQPLPESDRGLLDMIVSNPPYIRSDDPHLQQGDVRFEPLSALTSGPDGLNDIRAIVQQSHSLLKVNGWILIEHGYDQGKAVRNILSKHGFSQIRTEADLSQQDRVTLAQKN
ncbi:protein-(glutamine-N5) methyltransferase, release factor-specific [Endozoicomonas sp. (ex Bugula neritina AB1)]|nr:protein-(glutamine-N5) methyltransferase, release factor-specific [Endozoicomonas sp. (ex Bugula neritina AB1)]